MVFSPIIPNTDSVLLLSYMQGWFKLNIDEGMRKKVYEVRCLHTISIPQKQVLKCTVPGFLSVSLLIPVPMPSFIMML